MDAKQLLFDSLGELTPEDLRQLQARVSFLLPRGGGEEAGGGGNKAGRTHASEALVAKEMSDVLRGLGVRHVPPARAILASSAGKDFRDGAAAVVAYAATYLEAKTRPELVLAVRILLRVVARRMRDRRVTVTLVTFCRFMKGIEGAVEHEFPGYREAGLLHAVLAPRAVGSGRRDRPTGAAAAPAVPA